MAKVEIRPAEPEPKTFDEVVERWLARMWKSESSEGAFRWASAIEKLARTQQVLASVELMKVEKVRATEEVRRMQEERKKK